MMECNKDEAVRVKEISEKKMAENDFEGARTMALKAQKLYPELENISQLLSVCDVHCSAKKKVLGVDKDWYAILQIEQLVDDLTVKKQYRRLALVLHPDKNRFPGAEAAFKLISEANAILTDAVKKYLYDSKVRASASIKAPPNYMNRSSNINQRYGAPSSVVTNAFRNMHQYPAATSSSVRPDVFWTCCPYCKVRYQYQREHINKSLNCQNCSKKFLGCEIINQGVPSSKYGQPATQVPPKPGFSQPTAFHQKVELNQGSHKPGVQFGKGSSAPDGFATRKDFHPEPGFKAGSSGGINVGSAFNGNGNLKANGTNHKHGGKSNGVAPNIETADLKNSRKRGRKMVVESSESDDSSEDSDTDEEILEAKSGGFTTDVNPETVHIRRRSSRVKQNVTYKYNESDDDDFASPIKRRKESKKTDDKKLPPNANDCKSTSKEKATSHSEESLPGEDAKCDTEVRGGENGAADAVQAETDSDIESDSGDPGVVTSECPDPEFHDFDKEREENRFKINQIWACYDECQMPRYYATITKVSTSPFELSFKWLEVVPISQADEEWVDAELPVGCGTYKLGRKIEKTDALATFSHQMMSCVPGKKKGTLDIYPREKEVWALFKDWDIGWSLNPDKHVDFQFEVVEVLSDFVVDAGIRVCYLDKVAGFVSLFQRSSRSEFDSFWIRPDEMHMFSHRVPHSPELNGSERDGVPAGSFELDPASLPLNPNDLHFPNKAKKENGTTDPVVGCSPPKHAERKLRKSVKSATAANQDSFIDLEDSC